MSRTDFDIMKWKRDKILLQLRTTTFFIHQIFRDILIKYIPQGATDVDIRNCVVSVRQNNTEYNNWKSSILNQYPFLESYCAKICKLTYDMFIPGIMDRFSFTHFWEDLYRHFLGVIFIHPSIIYESCDLHESILILNNNWELFIVSYVRWDRKETYPDTKQLTKRQETSTRKKSTIQVHL